MFLTLMNIRLLIVDSCNELADDERAATAAAWADILDIESSRLIDSALIGSRSPPTSWTANPPNCRSGSVKHACSGVRTPGCRSSWLIRSWPH